MRDREQLIEDTTPFPESVIKSLPPRGDSYVAWNQYTQRLLLQHGGHRYEVTNVTHAVTATKTYTGLDDEGVEATYTKHLTTWAVSVRLFIDTDEWYDAVGEDDTPAAAESNAYKRACAHAGIGLHLYGDYWLHGRLGRDE